MNTNKSCGTLVARMLPGSWMWRRAALMLLAAVCTIVMSATPAIDITFSAEGESSDVESVTVTNLTHTDIEPVTLTGTDILRLMDPAEIQTAIDGVGETKTVTQPILTPNPSMGDGTLIFDVKEAGTVRVSIYAIDGKQLETATLAVEQGRNTALIPSQAPGIYIVSVEGKGIKASTRWICYGSPSGSRITLGGAGQWANVTLPVKSVSSFTSKPLETRAGASANVVPMPFNVGDVLRFEGTSGEMTTIVVNAPKRSHSVPFYFYPCKDVSGNTYPIVEAGGMLWMAEDLHALQKLNGVSIFYDNEASAWASAKQNKESTAMAMVVNDDDIYYTYAGARLALPEGWQLPTLGELNAVAENLGGYDVVGEKMKRSGDSYSFRDKRTALPDSLQLRISPKGYVSEEGRVTDTNSGFILTGTREKSKALYMSINNGNTKGVLTSDGLPSYAAVHVRGVRPAPSSYATMIAQLYSGSQMDAKSRTQRRAESAGEENPYTGEVNPYTGTPYGEYYTVDNSTKQMVLDVTGQKCMGWDGTFNLDESYFGTVFVNAADGSITQKQAEGDWIRNANGDRMNRTQLKKLCPQRRADGTYNTLKVSYQDVIAHDYQDDGSTDGHWMARDIQGKEGTLTLEVFGNAEQNFGMLRSIGLPGVYTMSEFDGFKENGTNWAEELRVNEYFMKRLNLLCADFNQDGVDDVVVGFCGQWMVLDGTDYMTVLARRTFPTDCVRACVGDLDENGFTDLGFIYQHNDQLHVRVLMDDVNKLDEYKHPQIDVVADYVGTLPVEKAGVSSFLDIKFDDITNTGKSVLCLAVPNRHISLNPKSAFYVLQRGSNNLLTQVFKFEEEQKVELSNMGNDRTSTNTNSTIAVVHTRGLGERPDVLLHNGLYRLNDANEFEQVNIGGYKGDGKIIDVAIPSDAVAVGRFTDDLEEGYEQLAYFGVRVAGFEYSHWSGSAGDWHRRGIYGLAELLTPNVTKGEMTRKELHNGVIGSHCNWTKDGDFHYGAIFPAFCATSYTNIDTRRYKFVSCQATMSEPRIKFALAAAPYWATVPEGYANAGEEYDYGDNGPSTEWATWTSTTSGKENSNSTSASVIFGLEQENKFSLFGVDIAKYGFEFETNLTHQWEKSVAHTDTWTYESGCSAGRDNKVGLTMTPYWLYTYECVDSNDPDNIGTTLICGAPSYPRDLELSQTDYMLLRGDRDDIPDVSTVFTHTPGNPLTYLSNPDLVTSTGGILWSNNNKDKYSTTGSDGTKSYSIEVSSETASTTQNTFGFDTKLVGFVGGANTTVKAGFGAGYSHTWSTIYNTSNGTVVTGTVPLPKRWGDVPIFDWNMYRHVVKVGGQEFPVVNYIVKNVRKSSTGK